MRLPVEADRVPGGRAGRCPPRSRRLRAVLVVAACVLLALVAVFKVLDIGFLQALNRPFDPLIDWRYAGSLVETVRGLGRRAPAATAAPRRRRRPSSLAPACLPPLAVLRLTHVAARHRRGALQAVAALAALWLVLGRAGRARRARDRSPRTGAAAYVYDQVSRIPAELRDRREFARAATDRPAARRAGRPSCSPGCAARTCSFVFVESYGRVAVEDPSLLPGVVDGARRRAPGGSSGAGFASRSAFLTSPTFGAISWLAHATLQSGLWVDSQQRYDVLVTSPRLTLSQPVRAGRAGARSATVPANTRDWPQGAFYGFDHALRLAQRRLPRAPVRLPDDARPVHPRRLPPPRAGARRPRPPVMAEIDLITSHAPWSRTPAAGRPGRRSATARCSRACPSSCRRRPTSGPTPTGCGRRTARRSSTRSSALVSFVTTYGDDDLVVVLLGDHQPATIVSGPDAGHDVPVAVLARDPAVLRPDRRLGLGRRACDRAPDAPVWRMDAFRDRFLAAYGPDGQTGDRPAGAR